MLQDYLVLNKDSKIQDHLINLLFVNSNFKDKLITLLVINGKFKLILNEIEGFRNNLR